VFYKAVTPSLICGICHLIFIKVVTSNSNAASRCVLHIGTIPAVVLAAGITIALLSMELGDIAHKFPNSGFQFEPGANCEPVSVTSFIRCVRKDWSNCQSCKEEYDHGEMQGHFRV
jgi:hypothetical protein